MATQTAQQSRATQDFVPIKEIRDGVVVLKNGGLRLVLMVSSLNFALKSADEQTAILLQFQNFLNSLDFHVQLFIQSRKLDIRPYLHMLEERLAAQTNDLLKLQTKEYIDFIREFTQSTDIMAKTFFAVVPYTPAILGGKKGNTGGWFKKQTTAEAAAQADANFAEHRTQLEQRAAVASQGFGRMGLRVVQLGTEELVELYFKIFNPGERETPNL